MQQKYSALRLVSNIYRGLGVLAVIGGLLLAVLSLLGSAQLSNYYGYGRSLGIVNLTSAFIIFIGCGLTGLGLYAFGELIQLLIAVEENTRASTRALNWIAQQQSRKEPQYSPRKNDELLGDF